MNTLYTDETLVSMFAQGNHEAFAIIYKKFYERVLRFSRRYVCDAEALDITADAFFQLWQKRENIDHIKALSSFLFVITRNRCYDIIKHNKIKNKHAKELSALMEMENHNDFFVEQVVVELGKLLAAEVDKLPVKMREVFILSFRNGLKPSQIAAQLKTSVKTVSNQKLSAIRMLRAALKQYSTQIDVIFLILLELELIF